MPTEFSVTQKHARAGAAEEIEQTCWSVAAEVAGDYAPVVNSVETARNLYGVRVRNNPHFEMNGHDDASPKTVEYFRYRAAMKTGSTAYSAANGLLAASVTMVDVGNAAKAAQALGSTAAHMRELSAIAQTYSRSSTIQEWLSIVFMAKKVKASARTTDLVGSAVPMAGAGLASGLISGAQRAGLRLTFGALIARAAMAVHWRAFQETSFQKSEATLSGPHMTGGGAPIGPACAIMIEIFRQRTMSRFIHRHQVGRLIQEPGGWMALNDKLVLL